MTKDTVLRKVRSIQQYLAIFSEILLLLAFFASGMDVSVSGVMADIPFLKWAWAFVFALGVDTAFVISWVRVRHPGRGRNLWWYIPVALGLSFVVFQPIMIQLLQQALNISFNQALAALGINLIILVYGRATVAVVLGAILALTNNEQGEQESTKLGDLPEQGEHQDEQFIKNDKTTTTEEKPVEPMFGGEQGERSGKQLPETGEHELGNVVNFHARREHQGEQSITNNGSNAPEGERGASTDVGEQIRALLGANASMSDRALAEEVGCSRSTANKWKRRIQA